MRITIMSTRYIRRHPTAVKWAAVRTLVILTEHGKPIGAVRKTNKYYRMVGRRVEPSLLDAMIDVHGGTDDELDLPGRGGDFEHRVPSFG